MAATCHTRYPRGFFKTSISAAEPIDHVFNKHSLAHNNATLNYGESLLVFNSIADVDRFIRALEERIKLKPPRVVIPNLWYSLFSASRCCARLMRDEGADPVVPGDLRGAARYVFGTGFALAFGAG